jgi:hypothetical protein
MFAAHFLCLCHWLRVQSRFPSNILSPILSSLSLASSCIQFECSFLSQNACLDDRMKEHPDTADVCRVQMVVPVITDFFNAIFDVVMR